MNENGATYYLDDIVIANSYIGPTSSTNHGAISLTFDDGHQNLYDYALPILQAHNVTGTFYIITNLISDFSGLNDSYLSLNELHTMQNCGDEIGSHTVNHQDLTTLSNDKINYELNASQQTLRSYGFAANNFAPPYGATDVQIDKIAAQYYRSSRQAFPIYDDNFLMKFPITVFSLPEYTVGQNGDNSDLPNLENIIDQVAATGSYAIFAFHNVQPNTTSSLTISTQDLNSFLDYVSSKKVATLTIDQALNITSTNPASQLVFTNGYNQSLTVGQLSAPITVQRIDQYGKPVTFEDTTVNLASSSNKGIFYSDAGNTIISSVKIGYGVSSVNVWYTDEALGSPTLTASSAGINYTNTIFTINQIQYSVTVSSNVGGTTTPSGTNMYIAGLLVPITATANSGYVFAFWTSNTTNISFVNANLASTNATINGSGTITATFNVYSQPTVTITPTSVNMTIGATQLFNSTTTGGFAPYTYQWYYTNGTEILGATTSTLTFKANSTGTYNIYLNVTDSQNNTARSNSALSTFTRNLLF